MEKNRGITLIALVVTIVVLLILAGVSISMLAGDNGIINQAKNANVQNAHGTVYEALKLEEQDYLTQKNLGKVEKDFITVLQDKGIIDSEYVIVVKTLVKEKLPTGAGSGTKDVYKLEESTELGKVASTGEVKIAEEEGNKIYDVVYYDKKGEKAKLGTIESHGGNNNENSVEGISEYYLESNYSISLEDWTIEDYPITVTLMYDEITEKYKNKYLNEDDTIIALTKQIDELTKKRDKLTKEIDEESTLSDEEVFVIFYKQVVSEEVITVDTFEDLMEYFCTQGISDKKYETLKEFFIGTAKEEVTDEDYNNEIQSYREIIKNYLSPELNDVNEEIEYKKEEIEYKKNNISVEIHDPNGEEYYNYNRFKITDMGKYEFTIKVNEKEYKFKVSIDRYEIVCSSGEACVYDFVNRERLIVDSGTVSNEGIGIKDENLPIATETWSDGIFNYEDKYSIIRYTQWTGSANNICKLNLKCDNIGYVSGYAHYVIPV